MLAIEANKLSKTIDNQPVVDNLSIAVPEGSIYGLLGPNGAGKTTTIRMIAGLIRPTSGEIKIFGGAIINQGHNGYSKIGALVESPSLYEHLSAEENLNVFATMLGLKHSRIKEALNIVALDDTGKKKVGNFSLGMKQRLGIAVAMLHNPPALILDEPTNGLDPEGIIEMRKFVKILPQLLKTTVLISSHQLHEIEQIADYVAIMNKGIIRFEGSLEELKQRYPNAKNLEDIFLTVTKE